MNRLNCIILVIAISLLAIVEAASASLESTLATSDCHGSVYRLSNCPIDAQDKRLLRRATKEVKFNEERGLTIPGLSKLKGWFTAFTSKIKESLTRWKYIRRWMKEKKTPDDVFKILELDKGTETLMANPKLKTWSVFMTTYNRKNSANMVCMIEMFVKTYGDVAVAKMLEIAKRKLETSELAMALLGQLLTAWMVNGLSKDFLFTRLEIDKERVDKLFSNPVFIVWNMYFYRSTYYDRDTAVKLIKKLLTVFDDVLLAEAIEAATKLKTTVPLHEAVVPIEKIAASIQISQFKKWLADESTPATILERIKIVDPNKDIYHKYEAFYQRNSK